ncbi:MAG: hypothetical protein ACTSVO_00635 [Candidatus Heimdallarchaeaceae archaeon]
MSYNNQHFHIDEIQTSNDLDEMIDELRILSANEKSARVISIIEKAIEESYRINHSIATVKLYELRIKQLFGNRNTISSISKTLQDMRNLSRKMNYTEGLILSYSIEWGLEKFIGNQTKSKEAIIKAMELIKSSNNLDEYIHNVTRYSYAIEIWLEDYDFKSCEIFEECVSYFIKVGNYKGLFHSLGYLSIIYLHMQRRNKAIKIAQRILSIKLNLEILPNDLQVIAYFFLGVSFKLQCSLSQAKTFFLKAKQIFEQNKMIKSTYYVPTLSHLLVITALQGNLNASYKEIAQIEKSLEINAYRSNLTKFNENQIKHTFNLTKFYIYSRTAASEKIKDQKLISIILKGCKLYYSDFVMLSEFILVTDIHSEKLRKMLLINNYSINRIKHIVEFKLEKQKSLSKISKEQKAQNCITILKNRIETGTNSFVEHVYVDLLIARQLFSSKRYAEISPLLKKYQKRLHKIDVLEMRIFMEAFIQVGAYKNGDPLGPALQYMAIKKCRLYGFSRLESKLLDYLQLQKKEITRAI